MARFVMSAAQPWIGALMAARSAKPLDAGVWFRRKRDEGGSLTVASRLKHLVVSGNAR